MRRIHWSCSYHLHQITTHGLSNIFSQILDQKCLLEKRKQKWSLIIIIWHLYNHTLYRKHKRAKDNLYIDLKWRTYFISTSKYHCSQVWLYFSSMSNSGYDSQTWDTGASNQLCSLWHIYKLYMFLYMCHREQSRLDAPVLGMCWFHTSKLSYVDWK